MPTSPRAGHRRADIQGLRAVAVLAVVLYHAGLPGLRGGFVGVDVFFVISGYLITGQLLRERRRSGHVSLGAFYARRARRLLPSATLTLVTTVIASAVVLPTLAVRTVCRDALSAAVFVSNYRFAAQQTDYLSASATPSPLQHTWSLGVEEQFYLFWPLLLLLAVAGWRRGRTGRTAVGVGLAGLVVASFVACVVVTRSDEPVAFFGLPTRAWEFAAGGLAWIAAARGPRLRRAVADALGWLGLAAVVGAVVGLSGSTPFPGTAAALPVLGAAAVLAAGERHEGVGVARLLGARPLPWLGNVSYSWYLWHWPVLILAPAALGRPLHLDEALAGAAAALVLAAATTAWLEEPVRRARRIASPRAGLTGGAALVATSGLAALLTLASLPGLTGPGAAVAAPRLQTVAQPAGHVSRPVATDSASPAPDPLVAQQQALATALARTLTAAAGTRLVPSNLTPALAVAAADKATPFDDGCHLGYTETTSPPCDYADTSSRTTVVLFGDSHAVQWFPALEAIAVQRHWKLVDLTKSICPPLVMTLWQPGFGRTYYECDDWRQNALARIKALHPVLVVAGVARHYGPEYRIKPYDAQWLSGMSTMVRDLRADGTDVLMMGPTPKPTQVVPTCLSAHLTSATSCLTARTTAVNATGEAAERKVVEADGGSYADVPAWTCARATCPVIVGSQLVYRDDNHLTTGYVDYLKPLLDNAVSAALGRK